MQLLGGIFKRDKQSSSRNPPSSHAPATTDSAPPVATAVKQSLDTDYVFPDKSAARPAPIYSGPPGASSSKLKLPFRRNRQAHPPDTPDASSPVVVSLNDVPPLSSVVSDPGHGLPAPPSKSSIFGVYNGRNSHSTHSIANRYSSSSQFPTDTLSTASITDAPSEAHASTCTSQSNHPPKKSGLFSWARQRTKSKAPEPPSTISSPPTSSSGAGDSTFNLKAFRHVSSGSLVSAPSVHAEASTVTDDPLPPPRLRPRGDSAASDSSQRISVAAFREAQARRSRANSPVPSFRPPSAADTLRLDTNANGGGRKRASTASAVSGMESPLSTRNSAALLSSSRPNSSAVQSSSDSDESESEDDEDVDSDGEPIKKPSRERTITRRGPGPRARSDGGHTSLHEATSPKMESARWPRAGPLKPSQSDAPFTPRTRASASTSALAPDAAARRASILAGANSANGLPVVSVPRSAPAKQQQQRKNVDSDTSSDSSSTDSEDQPLSNLVPPRRPGSSASGTTNRSARMAPPKPLIDIKTLVGNPPVLTPVLRHENSIKAPKGKERAVEKDEPFSPPPLRLSASYLSDSPSPSPTRGQTPMVATKPQTTTVHHRRMSSDATATANSPTSPQADDDLMDAIRLVNSFDMEREEDEKKEKTKSTATPSAPPLLPTLAAAEQSAADRIIPTPIRERQPPSSFAVVSRPPQRGSTAGILQTSPSANTPAPKSANVPPPITTTRSAAGTSIRPRSTTMVNLPSTPTDKSDSKSVASSTSRSSRIPAVPLIRSIPDSPSVKAEWRSSQSQSPTTKPRSTSVGPLETRSRSHSSTLVSLVPAPSLPASVPARKDGFVPHGSQSLMPQRPFISNSSVRGESPAPSSTGESSSGGPPFTPRDGSEIGVRLREYGSDVGSTVKARGHGRRPSVTFEDTPEKEKDRGRERSKSEATGEEKIRERRRSEAKAAIEFGKLVNGRGPVIRNDSDEELAPRGGNMRMSVNPMMGMEGSMPSMMTPQGWVPWQQPMGTGMSSVVPPQFSSDPVYLAAHQRAMMFAKQAYQMAVAQHAIAMAGEEWERNSNVGFSSGGSVYGGGSTASVYSGGGSNVVSRSVPGPAMGMTGMPSMGMLMPPGQWPGGPVMFPSTASMYGGGGISSSQSEFGGGSGWASKSAYGGSFGPSSKTNYLQAGQGPSGSSASAYGGPTPRPRAQTGATPPPSTSTRSPGRNRVAPPSSWKTSK
ncbi:hypothetical protein ID866_4433 [Astraeus odoratus]|nr:hypothetical protein ID866_4433 [Astraeus odoratus]